GNEKYIGTDKVNKELGSVVSKNKEIKWNNEILNRAYILSQSQISDFIVRDEPKERYDSLASIMGFEKINKLRNNIKNIRNEASKVNENNRKEYIECKNLKDEKEIELEEEMNRFEIDNINISSKFDISKSSRKLTELKTIIF